jgi:hypothetical protein
MAQDEEKKPGEGEGQPPSETFLAEQQRDPDEAVFAEQAIHHYVNWVLDPFREQVISTIEGFAGWVASQNDSQLFDNGAFLESTGQTFLHQMNELLGGPKSPIAAYVASDLSGVVDMAVRDEIQASVFINELARGARDACWTIRDNLQSILSNEWDQIRDLAYEGSHEFVPLLHKLGLPPVEPNTEKLTHKLQHGAEEFRRSIPQKKEQAEEKSEAKPEQDAAKDQTAEKDKLAFAQDEGKKAAS